jgi:hypothetical protein
MVRARRAFILGLDGEKGSLRPTSRSQSMSTLQMSSHGTAMPSRTKSSEQIVSAGLALVTLRALTRQATDTGRRLEPATTAGLAVACTANTANAAKSTATVTGARSGDLFLRHSQETAETVADDDTLTSLAAESALSPLRT